MRTLLITVLVALFAAPAAAETTPRDIQKLVRQVAAASSQPSSEADLDLAARALRDALGALQPPEPNESNLAHGPHGRRGRHGAHRAHHRERCIDIGFAAYKKAFDERYALSRAVDRCSGSLDADLIQLSFTANAKVFDHRVAFEKAVEFGRRDELFGKGELLRLAYSAYSKVYDSRIALREAADWVAPVRRRDEGCIRRAYYVYDKQFDSRVALRKAAETCAQ